METLQDDAINRRAAEVADWLDSVINIYDSLSDTDDESIDKIHFGIPDAFSKSIRKEDYHKYYEPRVVSIGPLHRGKPHLAPMEKLKWRAVRILTDLTYVSIKKAYATAEQDLLRIAKECYDVSRWGRISDPEWSLMMLLDGCFVILFFFDYFNLIASRYDWWGWCSNMKKHGRELFHRDLLLLENQLPLEVQRVLVRTFGLESTFNNMRLGSESVGIRYMPLVTFSGRLCSNLFNRYLDDICSPDPVHLLQSCRDTLVGALFKEEEEEPEELAVCPSFSVTELKKVGIHCRRPMDSRDTHIHFESSILSGHLFLPQLTMDKWTLTLFSNLRAYEYSHKLQNSSVGITSYLGFMSMLINGEEDVKELRARGLLKLHLEVDNDQVVNFFRDITADRGPKPPDFKDVKQQIFT